MDIIKFSGYIEKLKDLDRTGWTRAGIPNPESVADHSFELAILVMVLAADSNLDQLKVIKMALIHDIGEAIIGDIVTEHDRKVNEHLQKEKATAENEAVGKVFSLTHNDEYLELFKEFEKNETPEAKFVKQMDKLQMAIQAYKYENKHGTDLEDFYQTSFSKVKDGELRKILDKVYSVRPYKTKKSNP